MLLIIEQSDLPRLKPETVADILALLSPHSDAAPVQPSLAPSVTAEVIDGFNFMGVVDLEFDQVIFFMEGVNDKYKSGLRIIAESNKSITKFENLNVVGITNYSHFQGCLTKRVRTITGNKEGFLITWNDTCYAVTPKTHQSLRKYFGLD